MERWRAEGPPPYWTQRDGSVISVTLMRTDHIKACIARILRLRCQWRGWCLPWLYKELDRRAMG